MCGIVAIVSKSNKDHARLGKALEVLNHRGPDDQGSYSEEDVISLGHKRLSIIDLSIEAKQPFFNEDQSIVLVCNGEIYNYQELREELQIKGHHFISNSDNEVIIHLYEEYGKDCVLKLNGMFSFVLYDKTNRIVFCAVDRFGKKPLYYSKVGEKIIFASEMKSLLIFPWVKREINPQSLDRYFALRYVPAPLTIYKGIQKLSAASRLFVDIENNLEVENYWKVVKKKEILYDEQSKQNFHDLLSDAVKIRTKSDVPVGLYLSGGVDSSIVGLLMKERQLKDISAFSLDVDYKYNEISQAKVMADYLGFSLDPVTINEQHFKSISSIVYHLDEPFADLLAIPAYAMAKQAKEKLTVVLTGDGADEILTGYFHQKIMLKWKKVHILFTQPFNYLIALFSKLIPINVIKYFFDYPSDFKKNEKEKLTYALKNGNDFGKFYSSLTSCFNEEERGYLLKGFKGKPLSVEINECLKKYKSQGHSYLVQLSLLDLKYWIPFSVLFRLDKLNMASSVEARSPFLDYRVVEFSLGLEDKAKFFLRRNKIILRDLYKKMYSDASTKETKQAFYMPLTSKYRLIIEGLVNDNLTQQNIEMLEFLDWKYVAGLKEQFLSQPESMLLDRKVISILMLVLWAKEMEKIKIA